MSFISLLILAFAMSMDAFAVAIAKGALLNHRPTLWQALRMGLLFGIIEGLTPFIGWGLGKLTHQWIEQWDHWIAFCLLFGLGLKVIYEHFSERPEIKTLETEAPEQHKKTWFMLILTAIGTSLDAMTVGVSLAFLEANIALAMLMIGLATTLMVSLGILIGQRVGEKFGKYAELLGGLVLMIIGSFILYSHTLA